MAQSKLDFYQQVRQSLRSDIALIQNEYLLDGSDDIIREQHKKLAAIDMVIGEFKNYATILGNHDEVSTLSVWEQVAASLLDATLLKLERANAFLYSLWNDTSLAPMVAMRDLWHASLRHGRTKRYFVRRPIRDKRNFFRTLVRTLFKQMDDQSGHDDFLATPSIRIARILSLNKIWSPNDKHRINQRA